MTGSGFPGIREGRSDDSDSERGQQKIKAYSPSLQRAQATIQSIALREAELLRSLLGSSRVNALMARIWMLTMTESGLSPKQGTHGSFSLRLRGRDREGHPFIPANV
ncbi:MAG: hypothetical protein J0H75_14560, partial [Rhizobiales bacterium]|nr:hypothetical protein [Hyphomicrobiales bacterium]